MKKSELKVGDKVWVRNHYGSYEKRTVAHIENGRAFIKDLFGIEELCEDFMFYRSSIIQYQIFNLMTQSPLFGLLIRFVAHSLLATGFIFTLYALALVIYPITT